MVAATRRVTMRPNRAKRELKADVPVVGAGVSSAGPPAEAAAVRAVADEVGR
jgi:hypothetical protein